MVLREKLRDIQMTGSYMMTSYLTHIRQVRDELAVIGETMVDSELVRTILKGFTKEWASFIKGIVHKFTFSRAHMFYCKFSKTPKSN